MTVKLAFPVIACVILGACAPGGGSDIPRKAPGDAAYRQPALGDAANRIPKGTDSPGNVTGGPLD